MIPTIRQPGKSDLAALPALQSLVAGGAFSPIQSIFPTIGFNLDRPGRKCHSHTKKGPGRIHMQGDGSKEARLKSRHIVNYTF